MSIESTLKWVGTGAFLSLLAAPELAAQTHAQHAPHRRDIAWTHDTGWVEHQGQGLQSVASFTVKITGADSLRMIFDEVTLAGHENIETDSFLRITSWEDGAIQELHPTHVEQWGRTSAYFNGDTVQVDVMAYPLTGRNRVTVKAVRAELPPEGAKSQCGVVDDRILSSDLRSGRLDSGCTAWLADSCQCLITAGHCIAFGGIPQIMEFNVPLSSGSGSLNHPSPDHQYAGDASSVQSNFGGIGDDYGTFGVFRNPNTDLTPAEVAGGWFQLANPPAFDPNLDIRITGFGTDNTPSTHNQVQQTNSGPYYDFFGTTLRYTVDTTGGNSGSPVINEATGEAIGVHTHAGCNVSNPIEGNHGTGYNHAGFQAFMNNPLGVCANACSPSTSVNVYCTPKANSLGCLPSISGTGSATMSGGAGSFTVDCDNSINNKNGILFYGFAAAAIPFQGGFLCVQPPTNRTAVQASGGNPPPNDCSGSFSFDFGGLIASGSDPNLQSGTQVFAQYWMRDPSDPTSGTGLSDGAEFTIQP